jgi:hypothetical protein
LAHSPCQLPTFTSACSQRGAEILDRKLFEVALPVRLRNSASCRAGLQEALAATGNAKNIDAAGKPMPEQSQPSSTLYSACKPLHSGQGIIRAHGQSHGRHAHGSQRM